MILLDATTHTLEATTSAAVSTNYVISYVDITSSTFVPASAQGNITTATTTTVVSAPAGSTQRQIKLASFYNNGSAAQTVTVKKDISGTEYIIISAVIAAGESLQYTDGNGWEILDRAGRVKSAATQDTGYTGRQAAFYKVGTAPEAAGQWYSWAKDSGNPGAWGPGTPGLNGRATDGTTASDNGCFLIQNPTTGNNYLTNYAAAASVVCQPWVFDVLWVNSGLVVTTTTAQAIAPVALPARDINGSTNGEGVWAGILVTTATTNAGAITNMTMSYTNSDGTAGKTATIASFPATAVIGTVVWFQLAAGDKGVRSVQSVTLGTSLVAGAVSLILARPLANQPNLVANVGGVDTPPQNPGVRLYNGTCALPIGLMSGTGATTISGSISVMER